jgi:hypothetical protein
VNYYHVLNRGSGDAAGAARESRHSRAINRKRGEWFYLGIKVDHSEDGVRVHPDFVHVVDKDTMSLRILDYSAEFDISEYIIDLSKKQMRDFRKRFVDVKPYSNSRSSSGKLTDLLRLKPKQFEHIYGLVYSS